jgi:hypothetical protein
MMKQTLTLIPLFLNLELFCQVLVLLPLDFRADCPIIHEVAGISHFLLIHISLFEHLILEIFVGAEDKYYLEARLWIRCREIRDADINEVFKSTSVAVCDEIRYSNVVSESRKPEFRDPVCSRRDILRKWGIVGIIFKRLLLACFNLFGRRVSLTSDDRVSTLIMRLLQCEILSTMFIKTRTSRIETLNNLLLQVETFAFVLILKLDLFDLNAFQRLDILFNFRR